jgi:hypothetical protein
MSRPMKEFGLILERHNHYGTEYVVARLISREGDHPKGCSSDGERSWDGDVPKHLRDMQLDGLSLHGFITESDCAYIGFEPEYRDVYSVNLPKAERMAKTLRRVIKRQRQDQAREPGDVMMSLANALKLSFAVKRIGKLQARDYADNDWNFMSIAEGRNAFRQMIDEAIAEMRVRLGKAVA